MTKAGWRVELARSALRDLRRLDPPIRQRILAAIDGLLADPPTGDVVKLAGHQNEWRLRVAASAFVRVRHRQIPGVVDGRSGRRDQRGEKRPFRCTLSPVRTRKRSPLRSNVARPGSRRGLRNSTVTS